MPFKNKTVIVTGGTRGIGAGIAGAFLAQGATVIVTFANNEEAAQHFRASNLSHADRIFIRRCDVADDTAVSSFYADLEQRYDRIDVLVNNAGIRRDQILGMMQTDEWDSVLNVNLRGCYLMCKFAVRRMSRRRSGRIINITSPSGRIGFPGQTNYAASKAGMVALSRSLAQEVATRKITVNCVSPGFIETKLLSDLKDEIVERYKNMVPLRRFGTVAEVAHAVLFLASAEASYITGTVLEVAGGL